MEQSQMRAADRYVCRLIVAIVACVVSAATARAADIRGTMEGKVTPYKGGGTIGSFGFVLEGNIEPGDHDKLRSVYGDVRERSERLRPRNFGQIKRGRLARNV
jgi:hypothetical protein